MFDIWVIDDQIEICQEVIAHWQQLSANYPFHFRLFPTAKKALTALRHLPQDGKPVPQVILVDGHLRQDKGELSQGATVMREIIGLCAPTVPDLIAWSADPFANEEMKSVGAKASFGKTHPKNVALYLQRRYQELQH